MRTPPAFPFETIRRELERTRIETPSKPHPRSERTPAPDLFTQNLKIKIHRKLIDTIDLTRITTLESESVKAEIRHILEDMIMAEALPLSRSDRERIVTEIQHEAFGLGPVDPLTELVVEPRGDHADVEAGLRAIEQALGLTFRVYGEPAAE